MGERLNGPPPPDPLPRVRGSVGEGAISTDPRSVAEARPTADSM